jgi:uncharacterized tellurite resistance protein B-like protein
MVPGYRDEPPRDRADPALVMGEAASEKDGGPSGAHEVDLPAPPADTARMLTFLERLLPGRADAPPERERHHLAAAALLVEAARVDGHLGLDEWAVIERLLATRLEVAPEMIEALLREALATAEGAADWQGFTRILKAAYDAEGRIGLIEMLWEVVEKDGRVDMLEASLMRRVAALLYVEDRESAFARRRARARLGLTPAPHPG